MEVLGIRFCSVSPDAEELMGFFRGLGMPQRGIGNSEPTAGSTLPGAIFPAGTSWVEVWREGPGMPEGIMLQIVVDDADAFAAHARENGLDPQGPMDAHGERIYFLIGPGGLQVTFQSALA